MIRHLSLASLLALVASFTFAQEQKQPDTVVPVPRDANWMKRHDQINSRVKEGQVDLLFIGDSITQGWEGAGAKVWKEFYEKRNARNLGIGGDRTQHVLWRLDNGNIDGIKPKLAVIMIGTNNSGSNTSDEIAAGNEAIVKKLREKLPDMKILVLGIFPRGADNNDAKRKINAGANEKIAKLADNKNVFYLDIGPKFTADDGTLSKDVMPDLLHLNEKSYRTWAESIEPKVKELLGEK